MCSQKTDKPEDKNIWTESTALTLECIEQTRVVKTKTVYQCLTCDPKTFKYHVWSSKVQQGHVVTNEHFKDKIAGLDECSHNPDDDIAINENHERPRCYIKNVSQGLLLRLFKDDASRHADVLERNIALQIEETK